MLRPALKICVTLAALLFAARPATADEALPREIAAVEHDGPVDFDKEILPLLRKNCVACHSKTKKESDLSLETIETMLKGGDSGPALVPGKPLESLLLVRAAGGGDGIMPPEDNTAAAKPLSPKELGLLKLWIEQGASGAQGNAGSGIEWRPLAVELKPIYAVALSPDSQFAACGRSNQVFIYHVPTKSLVGRLTDPGLLASGIYDRPGYADLDIVQSMAFSPDGQRLATGGYRNVKLWQRPRDTRLHTFDKAAENARSLATSRDGHWLALGKTDGKIELIDLTTGKPAKTFAAHDGPVTALSFAADGTKLVSGSEDKSLRAWTIPAGEAAGRIDTPQPVTAVAILDDGKLWASAGGDNDIRLWTVPAGETKGELKATLKGHVKPAVSLATIAEKPTQLVSGAPDGQLIHWDAPAAKQIRAFNHESPITSVAARPDGKRFVSAGEKGIAKLWNAEDGKLVADLKHEYDASLQWERLSRNVAREKKLVAAEEAELDAAKKAIKTEADVVKEAEKSIETAKKTLEEKTAAYEKAKAAKEAADKKLAEAQAAKKANDDARAVADKTFADAEAAAKTAATELATATAAADKSKDDKKLAEAVEAAKKKQADADKALADARAKKTELDKPMRSLLDALKKPEAEVKTTTRAFDPIEKEYKSAVTARTSSDRALAAAQTASKAAETRQAKAESQLEAAKKSFEAIEKKLADATKAADDAIKPLRIVAFSSDGRRLATAGDDQLVHTWNSDSGQATDTLHGHKGAILGLAFAAEGQLVSAAADATAIVWNTQPEWTWLRTIGQGEGALADRVTAIDFSPDGRWLATGGGAPSREGELKLWNAVDGSFVREFTNAHSDTVFDVEFSPDGLYLASSAADKFLKTHNINSGKFVRSFEGHTHHVLGVTWLFDGLTLVSAGADNVLKVWDFASGDQKRTIQGFKKEVTSVHAVGDTTNTLATAGDPVVRLANTADGQSVRSFTGAGDFVYASAISSDGKVVVAGGEDSVLRLWDGVSGASVYNFEPPAPETGAKQAAR